MKHKRAGYLAGRIWAFLTKRDYLHTLLHYNSYQKESNSAFYTVALNNNYSSITRNVLYNHVRHLLNPVLPVRSSQYDIASLVYRFSNLSHTALKSFVFPAFICSNPANTRFLTSSCCLSDSAIFLFSIIASIKSPFHN